MKDKEGYSILRTKVTKISNNKMANKSHKESFYSLASRKET